MQTYFIVGGIVVVLGFVVWAVIKIYGAGKTAQRTDDLKRTEEIRQKQLDEANKPRDPASMVDALRKGGF